MSDFGEGRTVRARKESTCQWCHDPIQVGEYHFRFVGKWQGDFQDWRMHSDCEDAHQSETYEGEICEDTHQRGRTCADKDDAQREFAKEIGEEIKEHVEKAAMKGEFFYTNLAGYLIDLFEQWAEEEHGRVHEAAEKAMKPEAQEIT
jgi:hypothetical protein